MCSMLMQSLDMSPLYPNLNKNVLNCSLVLAVYYFLNIPALLRLT